MDKQTESFHAWLFDALANGEAYKAAANAIGGDCEAEVFERLVNQCRDLDPKKKYDEEKTVRKIRKKVLVILFREMDPRFLEGIVDLEAHEMDQCLIKKFREELRKRWLEPRREEQKPTTTTRL